jgi:hypothetical protein
MNRDEQRTRRAALPPRRKKVNGNVVLAPSEPAGGTWIAVNDHGATFALVNWYSIKNRVERKAVSRGEVVNAVSASGSLDFAEAMIASLPLNRVNPFRLIGIFPARREVVELRWDLKKLSRKGHQWETQQWISSGYNETAAQLVRGKIFRQALRQHSAGSRNWLRRLHRSHDPETGPFSTCVHRADAETVSYTEVAVSSRRAKMCYHPGAPCQDSTISVHRIRLRTQQVK